MDNKKSRLLYDLYDFGFNKMCAFSQELFYKNKYLCWWNVMYCSQWQEYTFCSKALVFQIYIKKRKENTKSEIEVGALCKFNKSLKVCNWDVCKKICQQLNKKSYHAQVCVIFFPTQHSAFVITDNCTSLNILHY